MIRKSEIIMGNFIFCLLRDMPVMGNDCRGCEYILQEGDTFYCTLRKKMQIFGRVPRPGLITSKYLDNLADYFVNYFLQLGFALSSYYSFYFFPPLKNDRVGIDLIPYCIARA